jgi:hypothetical protein
MHTLQLLNFTIGRCCIDSQNSNTLSSSNMSLSILNDIPYTQQLSVTEFLALNRLITFRIPFTYDRDTEMNSSAMIWLRSG